MLNFIWAIMLAVGIVYGLCTGNASAVSDAILESAGEAVTLCITMTGIVALWMGLMEIAEQAGLIRKLTKLLQPVIHWIFPDIPLTHPACDYITANLCANILGLGWACTPPGLKAMEELSKLNHQRESASDAMCAFLILNISSLQLIPVNLIAYRTRFHSAAASGIILPAILATTCSTLAGLFFIKGAYHKC